MEKQNVLNNCIKDQKTGGAAAGASERWQPGFVESESEVRKRIYGLLKSLQKTYPHLSWRFDYSGEFIQNPENRVSIHSLNRRGFPDLMIFNLGRVCFLELKASNIEAKHLLNPIDEHGRDQLTTIQALRSSGFDAGFAIGYQMAYRKIYSFLDGREIPLI